MPIPTPNTNETQGDFMARCVSFLVDEGRENEQAVAICFQQYRESNKKEAQHYYMTWKTFDNKRRSFERYAERTFYRALRKQLKQYLDEVDKRGTIDFDIEGVVTTEPMAEAYTKVYKRVMKVFGQESYAQVKESVQKETGVDWDILIEQWIAGSPELGVNAADTTSKIVLVTETTKKLIRTNVASALQEGTSIPDFARQLRKDYGFSLRRGTLIGRTEIVSASNAGSVLGAQASGVPTRKIWLSTQDDRTRDLHIMVSGQKVPNLETPFKVGGDEMQYPGDSSLGAAASNTINCRCTVIYEPYDDNF